MSAINVKHRDRLTLWLLSWTQANARLIHKASETFELPEDEDAYRDERRVRERLQALAQAGLVRASPIAASSGGVTNWYRLTVEGFRTVCGAVRLPPKSFFEPIRVSRQEHTVRLAEAIVHTLVAARQHHIEIAEFRRENELQITGGNRVQYPDCFFRFRRSGRQFNLMVELDNGTEPLDSSDPHSIREKLLTYEAHQDYVLRYCRTRGFTESVNPRFRVLFLTRTAERAENIVAIAGQLTQNKDRLLCYAATLDDYLSEPDALRSDIFLDHQGRWQRLVNTNPTVTALKTPVRLPRL